jgi:nucleoside diphosphate kinase
MPDGVERGLIGEIINSFETKRIVASDLRTMNLPILS